MTLDNPVSPSRIDDHDRLRLHVEGVCERARQAVPWSPETVGIPAQGHDDGLLRLNDVAFYANARDEVAAFTEVFLALLGLHRPRDGCGVSSGPTSAARRCTCCMLRWPCPTIREMARLVPRTGPAGTTQPRG